MKISLYINKSELVDCYKKQSKATPDKPVDISYCYGNWWLDEQEAKSQFGKNSKQIKIDINI